MHTRFIVEHPPGFTAERSYCYRYVLEERLGLGCDYRSGPPGSTRIYAVDGPVVAIPDRVFATDERAWPSSLADLSLQAERVDLPGWLEPSGLASMSDVATLFRLAERPAADRTEASSGIDIGFDLFGAVFFMLSGAELAVSPMRDEHSRLPDGESAAIRAGYSERPVVDEWIALLGRAVAHLYPGQVWPRGHYGVEPTHDIDHLFLYHHLDRLRSVRRLGQRLMGDLLLRRSAPRALASLRDYRRYLRQGIDGDPYFKLHRLMEESERRDLSGTFYFIVAADDPMDGVAYDDDPAFPDLLRQIAGRGHRIGLHASYRCIADAGRAQRELRLLRRHLDDAGIDQEVIGIRHHYLRWPDTGQAAIWEAAGAGHDSTVAFSRTAGFRSGTSHRFPLFDVQARRPLSLVEEPLLFMEASVGTEVLSALAGHRTAQSERFWARLDGLLAQCRSHAGTFRFLWHNTSLVTSDLERSYNAFLDRCMAA